MRLSALLFLLACLLLPASLRAQISFGAFNVQACQGAATNQTQSDPNAFRDGSGNLVIHTSNPRFGVTLSTAGAPGLANEVCGPTNAAYPVPTTTGAPGEQDMWLFDNNGNDSGPAARNISFAGYTSTGTSLSCNTQTYITAKNGPGGLGQAFSPYNSGSSCQFQYGKIQSPSDINFAAGAFTIEAWVKYNGAEVCANQTGQPACPSTDWPILLSCQNPATDTCLHVVLRPSPGNCNGRPTSAATPYFGFYGDDVCGDGSPGVNGVASVSDGNWHHLAFVYDGTSRKDIFEDGVDIASATGNAYKGTPVETCVGGSNAASDFCVGPGNPGVDGFQFANGGIDTVRFYNRAESQGTIAFHALAQWYSFANDSKFDGNLSGGYCGPNGASVMNGVTYPGYSNANWGWTFGTNRNIIPNLGGKDTVVPMLFAETDTKEDTTPANTKATISVDVRQQTMTPPPNPYEDGNGAGKWTQTTLTFQMPPWFCDTPSNTSYIYTSSDAIRGTLQNTTTQNSKTLQLTGLNVNTRYTMNVNATYIDNAPGNGSVVGPSLPDSTTSWSTLTWPPANPSGLIITGKTGIAMQVNTSMAGHANPGQSPNPPWTITDLEASNDNGVTWFLYGAYTACFPFPSGFPPPYPPAPYPAYDAGAPYVCERIIPNLSKSSAYIFRSQTANLDGFYCGSPAPGRCVSSPQMALPALNAPGITQPLTPTNFGGTSNQGTPGLTCPKTQVLWTWTPVGIGSTLVQPLNQTHYFVEDQNGNTLLGVGTGGVNCTGCITANQFLSQNLAPNTLYQAEVQAYDSGAGILVAGSTTDLRYSDVSIPGFAQTAVGQNVAPTLVSGTSLVGGILWSWQAPPNLCAPNRYFIYDARTLALLTTEDVPGQTITYTENGLGANAEASIVVAASDTIGGLGPLSGSATQYSQAFPPVNLMFTGVSTASASLSWSANGNPAYTRFEVSESPDNFTSVISTPVPISLNFTQTAVGFNGLTPGTTYYFRVRAINGQASDNAGQVFTAFSNASAQTLFPPPSVGATANSQTQITWSWPTLAAVSVYQAFQEPGDVLLNTYFPPYANPINFVEGGLAVNTQYGLKVVAFNAQDLGSASSTTLAFTLANPPIIPPNDIVGVTSNSVSYQWLANGNAAGTFYEVDVATEAQFTTVVATATPSSTGVTIRGLFPDTTYFGEIRAFNGALVPVNPYQLFDSTKTDADPDVSKASASLTVYSIPPGVVGAWHFDEDSGTVAYDFSGYNDSATMTCLLGACISTPTWTSGPPNLGSAVLLSGLTSSYAYVNDAPQYHFAAGLTVEAWVDPALAGEVSGAGILAKGPWGGEDFFLDASGGAFRFSGCPSGSGLPATAAAAYAPGQWTHVAGVWSGGLNTIYINGVASASAACPGRVNSTYPLTFGSRKSATGAYDLGFNGAVDEARVVNGAYTAAQVQQDYKASFASTITWVGANSSLQLVVPPNAFGAAAEIYATADPVNHPLKISVPELMLGLLNPPTGQTLVPGLLVEIVPTVNGAQFTGPLGSSATIIFSYADADNDGIIDGTKPAIHASTLKFYTLDTSIGQWVALPTTVNLATHQVYVYTPHFSVFAGFGTATTGVTTTQARIFPVPWKIGSQGIFDAPALTFDTLPPEGIVRIFTLSGQKVVDLPFEPGNAGKVTWNGQNGTGRPAASGVYFAYIKSSDGSTRVLKFAIER